SSRSPLFICATRLWHSAPCAAANAGRRSHRLAMQTCRNGLQTLDPSATSKEEERHDETSSDPSVCGRHHDGGCPGARGGPRRGTGEDDLRRAVREVSRKRRQG